VQNGANDGGIQFTAIAVDKEHNVAEFLAQV